MLWVLKRTVSLRLLNIGEKKTFQFTLIKFPYLELELWLVAALKQKA